MIILVYKFLITVIYSSIIWSLVTAFRQTPIIDEYLSARSHRCRRRRGPYLPLASSAHQMAPRSGMQLLLQRQQEETRHRCCTARPQSPTGTCCSGWAPCCSHASRAASRASTSRRFSRTPRLPSGCATSSSVCHTWALSTPVQQPPLDLSNRTSFPIVQCSWKMLFVDILVQFIDEISYDWFIEQSFVFRRSLWLDQRYRGCISHWWCSSSCKWILSGLWLHHLDCYLFTGLLILLFLKHIILFFLSFMWFCLLINMWENNFSCLIS